MHREHGELYLREPDREDQNRFSSDSGLPDRSPLADSCGERCGGKEWGGEAEEKRQSERHSSERSGDSSVAYSKSGGRRQEQSDARRSGTGVGSQKPETGGLESGNTIGRSSVGNPDSNRPQERHEATETAGHRNSAHSASFWSDSETIYCRDGKYRPIPTEPALFPLANGIPNRVGILRGAGNAIVPQAAAEIIKAYLESKRPNVFEKLP